MAPARSFDRIITNVRVVRPNRTSIDLLDIGIRDGRIARLSPHLPPSDAAESIDAGGLLGFPGLVDAHVHLGLGPPRADEAGSTRAAAIGGVTTIVSHVRAAREEFDGILARCEGRLSTDYAFHLGPVGRDRLGDMERVFAEVGVSSFTVFLPDEGRSPDDLAHLEFVMRGLTRLRAAYPASQPHLSLGLHCELAAILDVYTEMVRRDQALTGLRAFDAGRPPHSEGLAIVVASYLAHETGCVNLNLLHLSSRKAVEAAILMERAFPDVSFRREATIGHLLLDRDTDAGAWTKAHPPLRPRQDVDELWRALLDRRIDWVSSEHACCAEPGVEDPTPADGADTPSTADIWRAAPSFGGAEFLLSGLLNEGSKRGMSYNHMAEVVSWNPAQRFGLFTKGDIAPGYDADLALVDPSETFIVHGGETPAGRPATPFEDQQMRGRVRKTFLRGELAAEDGRVTGPARGRYLRRPPAS